MVQLDAHAVNCVPLCNKVHLSEVFNNLHRAALSLCHSCVITEYIKG